MHPLARRAAHRDDPSVPGTRREPRQEGVPVIENLGILNHVQEEWTPLLDLARRLEDRGQLRCQALGPQLRQDRSNRGLYRLEVPGPGDPALREAFGDNEDIHVGIRLWGSPAHRTVHCHRDQAIAVVSLTGGQRRLHEAFKVAGEEGHR